MARDADVAWAAGLFEGEGSICTNRQKHNGKTRPVPCMELGLRDYDKDVLLRFQRMLPDFGPLK